MLLEGMYLPLTTPFTLEGHLNLARLEANVARYSKTPAAGLVALSRWGQPNLLSEHEQHDTLKTVAHSAAPTKVLIAGIARDSVSAALKTIETAATFSYDVALLRPPTTGEGDQTRRQREAILYCTAIADRSPLPVLLSTAHNRATALTDDTDDSALTDNALVTLATHPNILGVVLESPPGTDHHHAASIAQQHVASLLTRTAHVRREATVTQVFAPVTGRMIAAEAAAVRSATQLLTAESLAGGTALMSPGTTQRSLKTRTKTIGFQILAGSTATLLSALEAGAVGILPGFAASAPQACYEVFAAWKDGDPALAAEKQQRIQPMALKIEEQFGVVGLNYAAELTGYFGGRPRLPGLPLTAHEREAIEALMQGMKN